MTGGAIILRLRAQERERLRKPVIGSGGYQVFLHRLQRGLHGDELRIHVDDLGRLVNYWLQGKGGFQRRFPIASLARHLPSAAPLFRDLEGPAFPVRPCRWIYFVRDSHHRIKIGVTTNRARRGGGLRTDNADRLVVLLWLPETDDQTEADFHRRFSHLRIRGEQEWFWPGDDLQTFIECATQQEARRA